MNLELETILTEQHDSIVTATINRPKALNALNAQVLSDLEKLADTVAGDKTLRALILTGAGKAFVAGADIAAMAEMDAKQAEEFSALGHRVFAKLEQLPIPVLAAVNGFALGGGCELALATRRHLRVHQSKVWPTRSESRVDTWFWRVCPSSTQSWRRRGIEWIFSGDIYNADTAASIGLVQKLFEPEALLEEVKAREDHVCPKPAR